MNPDDVQNMTRQLRRGVAVHKPQVKLGEAVECDEVYVYTRDEDGDRLHEVRVNIVEELWSLLRS